MGNTQARLARATTAVRTSERGAARRRTRRARALYCATNGCTSFLDVDERRGVAVCHICGYERRLR